VNHRLEDLMPTKLPRVIVTLPVELHAAVVRAASAAGVSKSALIADLLEPSAPVLHRMADVLEAAASAPEEARRGMVRALDAAMDGIVPVLQTAAQLGAEGMAKVAAAAVPAERAPRLPAPSRPGRRSRTPV
jgi:hypothetical protein